MAGLLEKERRNGGINPSAQANNNTPLHGERHLRQIT